MCGGALYWSQLEKIVFAAKDDKRGAGRHEGVYHPKTKVLSGIMEEEAAKLMTSFFEARRKG